MSGALIISGTTERLEVETLSRQVDPLLHALINTAWRAVRSEGLHMGRNPPAIRSKIEM